eukprot:Em0002g1292a
MFRHTESYYPFPSKLIALLFFHLHSPRPMGQTNLSFMWATLKGAGVEVPSLSQVKHFQLPDFVPPKRVLSPANTPFYVLSISSIISHCLGSSKLSHLLARYPVVNNVYTEIFHGKKWSTDSRFASPMAELDTGVDVFVRDCVYFQHPKLGLSKGVIVKFFQVDSCKEVYCEIDTLVDFNRFAQIVPDTEAYIPEHVNIIFDMIAIPISSVHAICEKPAEVIKWDELAHSFIRLSHEDSCNYLKPNHLKTKAAGRKVVMLPLILFTDDLSGNKSKKWHKFESWYLMLAGLPRHENAKPENIHFVSCTDLMDVLDMTECVAQQLQQLELDGLIVYDSFYKETVLVIAPLLCVICDNPRASQLLNHLGGSAKKFCRFCMADRDTTPCSVCEERTRDISLQQIQEIQSQRTEKAKSDKSTEVGLRDVPNSLLHILADLFK